MYVCIIVAVLVSTGTCVCICFLQRASKALELPDQVKEMRDHVLAPTLEKLKLDEAKSIG